MKCSICYENNPKNSHYCKKCGSNLTNKIEKTDIIRFISRIFIVFGIIGIFLITFPIVSCSINDVCIDGDCLIGKLSIKDIVIMLSPIILLVIGIIMYNYVKRLCLKNIGKNRY